MAWDFSYVYIEPDAKEGFFCLIWAVSCCVVMV
jgi:hypothetical protein